jgi:hypothetical protein
VAQGVAPDAGGAPSAASFAARVPDGSGAVEVPGGVATVAVWVPEPGTLLGEVVGARSGDKGGNANVGLWIPDPGVGPSAGLTPEEAAARYEWLESWLTPDRVHDLLPETAGLVVDVHPLPNLSAVNVVIRGLLGRGVADSTSLDPQAKGLAEHLRARRIC